MIVRKIYFYENRVIDFYKSQNQKIQEKIEYVLELIQYEKQIPIKFFKKLENTNGIYEIRVITYTKSIRILCFYDNDNLIVLTNCFIKKTQKTPKKEILIAQKIKEDYLKLKKDE